MSRLRFVVILASLAVVLAVTGCRNPFQRFTSSAPSPMPPAPPPVAPHPPAPPPVADEEQANAVVTAYLTALRQSRYDAAYDMLSQDSQGMHPRANFAAEGKQGMPRYDLTSLTATVTGDRALVAVKLDEEPGSGGFTLVRERREWKVVYRGGRPGQPYPD